MEGELCLSSKGGGESALYLSDKQSRWEDVFKAVRLELMGEVFETGSS